MTSITKISGRSNQNLAAARKVRDGKSRQFIFVEGVRIAEEALRTDLPILDVFISQRFTENARGRELTARLLSRNARVYEVAEAVFSSIADTDNSQGIVLIAERPAARFLSNESSSGSAGLYLFLQEINDPANVGAVFRTAEAANVTGIFVSRSSADIFSPKALRAAMGSNLRVPVESNADLADAILWARHKGIVTIAADLSGKIDHTDVAWTRPSLVVFGSEAHGLSENHLDLVDEIMKIPMQNAVESLNLAVSAGIILFEAVRQRSKMKLS